MVLFYNRLTIAPFSIWSGGTVAVLAKSGRRVTLRWRIGRLAGTKRNDAWLTATFIDPLNVKRRMMGQVNTSST